MSTVTVTLTEEQLWKLKMWYAEIDELYKIKDPVKRDEALRQFESQQTYNPQDRKIQ